jgi:hypothetical protein
MAVVPDGADPNSLTPADVQENGPFLRLLSRVIFETIDQCGDIRRHAQDQGSGYLYLLDERTPDPGGRVPPEDIVGAIEVSDGKPLPGSYQHNPRHRLLTPAGWSACRQRSRPPSRIACGRGLWTKPVPGRPRAHRLEADTPHGRRSEIRLRPPESVVVSISTHQATGDG